MTAFTKNELRAQMKQRRRALTATEIAAKSRCITSQFLSSEQYLRASCIMVYLSAFHEPDTAALIDRALADGKRIVVPITHTDTHTLTLSYLTDRGSLTKGAYHISEPAQIIPASERDLDAIIVPGLAFDTYGNRLGFGAGYYDRLLSDTSAIKVGFCYDFQLIDTLVAENHDIPMNMLITETKILQFTGDNHAF